MFRIATPRLRSRPGGYAPRNRFERWWLECDMPRAYYKAATSNQPHNLGAVAKDATHVYETYPMRFDSKRRTHQRLLAAFRKQGGELVHGTIGTHDYTRFRPSQHQEQRRFRARFATGVGDTTFATKLSDLPTVGPLNLFSESARALTDAGSAAALRERRLERVRALLGQCTPSTSSGTPDALPSSLRRPILADALAEWLSRSKEVAQLLRDGQRDLSAAAAQRERLRRGDDEDSSYDSDDDSVVGDGDGHAGRSRSDDSALLLEQGGVVVDLDGAEEGGMGLGWYDRILAEEEAARQREGGSGGGDRKPPS